MEKNRNICELWVPINSLPQKNVSIFEFPCTNSLQDNGEINQGQGR